VGGRGGGLPNHADPSAIRNRQPVNKHPPVFHDRNNFIRTAVVLGMEASSKYKLLEQVGNGSFGVVYKAVNKDTGEVVAIKEVVGKRGVMADGRLILRVGMTILLKSSRKSLF
jgi:hypothetical protein